MPLYSRETLKIKVCAGQLYGTFQHEGSPTRNIYSNSRRIYQRMQCHDRGAVPHGDNRRIKDVPRNLKPYFLGLLIKGERWNDTEGEQAAELMQLQLAFLRSQMESQRYLVAGPVLDEGRLAGVMIIDAKDSGRGTRPRLHGSGCQSWPAHGRDLSHLPAVAGSRSRRILDQPKRKRSADVGSSAGHLCN